MFVAQVDKIVGAGVLCQREFQERPFMKFWSNSLITEYVEEDDDYRFLFFGTAIANLHGRELTGKYLSDVGFRTIGDTIRQLNFDVVGNVERIYSSGTLDIMNKDYNKWWHVKIPLERNGKIGSSLTYVVYK